MKSHILCKVWVRNSSVNLETELFLNSQIPSSEITLVNCVRAASLLLRGLFVQKYRAGVPLLFLQLWRAYGPWQYPLAGRNCSGLILLPSTILAKVILTSTFQLALNSFNSYDAIMMSGLVSKVRWLPFVRLLAVDGNAKIGGVGFLQFVKMSCLWIGARDNPVMLFSEKQASLEQRSSHHVPRSTYPPFLSLAMHKSTVRWEEERKLPYCLFDLLFLDARMRWLASLIHKITSRKLAASKADSLFLWSCWHYAQIFIRQNTYKLLLRMRNVTDKASTGWWKSWRFVTRDLPQPMLGWQGQAPHLATWVGGARRRRARRWVRWICTHLGLGSTYRIPMCGQCRHPCEGQQSYCWLHSPQHGYQQTQSKVDLFTRGHERLPKEHEKHGVEEQSLQLSSQLQVKVQQRWMGLQTHLAVQLKPSNAEAVEARLTTH